MSARREPAAPKRHRGGAAGDAADGTPRLRPFRPSQATAAEPRGEDGPAQTRRCARESPPGLLAPPPVEAAVAQRTAPGSRPRSRTWSRTRTRTNAYATPFVCWQMTDTQKRPVRLWTEAFRARNNRLAYDEERQTSQPAPSV